MRLHRLLSFSRGIFALFFRSLRSDSRSIRIHLLWFLLAAVIYASLWVAQSIAAMFGAPGLYFFRNIMFLDAAFITLLGISFFSNVITEEKEENTLGLMTMAGISPLGLLLGKSTSRLFQVLLLLAIQYPFTFLAVTMGGLLPTQITSAYAALFSYTILLANVGLFCSVLCRNSRNASGLTTLWLVGYLALPVFALQGHSYLTMEKHWTHSDYYQSCILSVLNRISESVIYMELYNATETGHEFAWSTQIVSNAAGGLILFLLAWPLFRFVAAEPEIETATRGIVARRTSRTWRLLSAGRAWSASLIWKDFFFVGGGWVGILIRCQLYIMLFGLTYAANRPWYSQNSMTFRWQDVIRGFQIFAHPILAVELSLSASRFLQEEIKGQTLPSLLMLPRSVPSLFYSKVTGCLLAATPGFVALLVSFFLPGGTDFVHGLLGEPIFLWWLMNLLLLIHLSVVLSIYLRSGTFVLAIGCTVGSMILTVFLVESICISSRSQKEMDHLIGVCAVGLGIVCAACHPFVLLRLPTLGEK